MTASLKAFWLSSLFFWAAVLTAATPALNLGTGIASSKPVVQAFRHSSKYFDILAKSGLASPFQRAIQGQIRVWDMVALFAACGLVQAYRLWTQRPKEDFPRESSASESSGMPRNSAEGAKRSSEAHSVAEDPGLLKKHSTLRSYQTSCATYDPIRTFYRPHPQADKLPHKPPIPLLVFIHGLGGSLAQFHSLLTSLVNVAPCLGFDLPGCGLSPLSPDLPWEAYSTEALSELVRVIIKRYCDYEAGQGIVLVGHSMGCSLSVMLASKTSPLQPQVSFNLLGQVAICPKASRPTHEEVIQYRKLLRIPTPIFDLWRKWDRRGGPESASVRRFVGDKADIGTKKLQFRFNENSRTAVWRRMAWGALPDISRGGDMVGGLPGPEIWAGLAIPLFLVAGEADNITKPEEIKIISNALGRGVKDSGKNDNVSDEIVPRAAAPDVEALVRKDEGTFKEDKADQLGASSTEMTIIGSESSSKSNSIDAKKSQIKPRAVLKTTILPRATHALLYDHATYRTLAGLIQTFLAEHIDSRLSLGWQLQHLSTEGKWDVKNLVKWQAVRPVSEPIGGIFRAMKTLREIDESHSPAIFVKYWKDYIKAVIDISHESPVYDPRGLEAGGVEYHKFPTVSKIPPTPEEVRDFVALVDRLRSSSEDRRLLGVHCHYGFNRTGFFICSYLIEREGYNVQRAIDAFQESRPPGIRHEHFIDALFVRYCVGLKRAPTL
ncbi:hypothetical protein MMC30_004099 [Trapelia coarctata]|nr:hypothetical protein [Trapelia coarctata]